MIKNNIWTDITELFRSEERQNVHKKLLNPEKCAKET